MLLPWDRVVVIGSNVFVEIKSSSLISWVRMSQIDNLLNFVAGNSENREVMSSVDDGWRLGMDSQIDVFSWLLINSDLFTLNNDRPVLNPQQSSKEPTSSLNQLRTSQNVD